MKRTKKSIPRRARRARSSSVEQARLSRPIAWPLRDTISLCAQNFVPSNELPLSSETISARKPRICAAWIELLPMLLGNADADALISSATKVLSIAILARLPNSSVPAHHALEAQSAALHDLHSAVRRANVASFNMIAAAIMCIFLAEVRGSVVFTYSSIDFW